jgi:hypothetical protein
MDREETTKVEAVSQLPEPADQAPEKPADYPWSGVRPMTRKAMEKHAREWEGLMKRHAGQWVIYRGDIRLEIGKSRPKLYRKYLDRGIPRDELLVLSICPPLEDDPDDEQSSPESEGPSVVAEMEVHPMIRKAMEKHRGEWEGLMKRYAYRWAAYHGDVRLEIGKEKHRLYRKYRDRGIPREELVVLGIGPPIEDEHDR